MKVFFFKHQLSPENGRIECCSNNQIKILELSKSCVPSPSCHLKSNPDVNWMKCVCNNVGFLSDLAKLELFQEVSQLFKTAQLHLFFQTVSNFMDAAVITWLRTDGSCWNYWSAITLSSCCYSGFQNKTCGSSCSSTGGALVDVTFG